MAPDANARQIVTATVQALPTWLTYSPIVGPSGTSWTILRLPLTYYGPSIPLGTDGTWTYGGLSSPAPSSTAITTSTAPPATTSPPTTTFSSSTLPTSTSLSSTTSLTSTSIRTTTFASVSISTRTRTSSTATSTSTAPPGHGSPLPAIAIALIALGAAAAVLLCCLVGALLWRRRKSRREREPPRGDSEFYAGPGPDDELESIHAVPNLTGERHSLLGNDSFIVVGNNGRSPHMTQRSFNGVSYQRIAESRAPSLVSRRTGSDEIGVAYTDMPPPRTRRRTVTAVSNALSSSPSHPTSSSQPGIGSMRNGSQRSSLYERPAAQDESPVLPRDSAHSAVKRASDLGQRPLQAPAPAAQPSTSQYGEGATLGTELGMLGLGTRYPDPSQSLLATSSSGGSYPPRLVVPTPSSLGSRSRLGADLSRPPSQLLASSQAGSRASRGHSPIPSVRASPPPRDTLTWPDSPESEHDESAQLLTAERGNVRSGIGLLGRFSWFTRGNGSSGSPAARTSRLSYPGWMSPPTEEGFLAEADSSFEAGPSTSDPPTLESKPPTSHPGMVRLVPRERTESNTPRPTSSVSGNTVYHDASSQPATPRSPVPTWLGFLGRGSSAAGPAPPVPQRPSPLTHTPASTPVTIPSTSITPPQPARTRGSSDSEVDPASRLPRDEAQRPSPARSEVDILDAPAPESLLDISSPVLPPPSPAPVFPPGLLRLPRTWNFGLLNELGDEPPAAEERWANMRASPDLRWDLRRISLGRTVRINSPQAVTSSQVGSVHGGGTGSPTLSDPTSLTRPVLTSEEGSSRSRSSQAGQTTATRSDNSRPSDPDPSRVPDRPLSMGALTSGIRHSVSTSGAGTSADSTTVSSHTPYPPETLVTESGRFGFEFGGFGYMDSEYDDYETRATTISSNDSSGREAVDLHGETDGQDVYVGSRVEGGGRFIPPMSAVGLSGWGQQFDANPGRA